MARHLSLATVVDKNRVASLNAFITLIEVEIRDIELNAVVETLRFAHNNEDLDYRGNTYTRASFGFTVNDSSEGVKEAKITVQDQSQEILARMEAYAGGVGFRVRLMVVNTGNLSQPPEIDELIYVMSSSAKNYVAEFVLGADNPLGQRFPRRLQWRNRCAWLYRGKECGYTGGLPTCDYSLQGANGCAAHSNTPRFGGFPGIIPR